MMSSWKCRAFLVVASTLVTVAPFVVSWELSARGLSWVIIAAAVIAAVVFVAFGGPR